MNALSTTKAISFSSSLPEVFSSSSSSSMLDRRIAALGARLESEVMALIRLYEPSPSIVVTDSAELLPTDPKGHGSEREKGRGDNSDTFLLTTTSNTEEDANATLTLNPHVLNGRSTSSSTPSSMDPRKFAAEVMHIINHVFDEVLVQPVCGPLPALSSGVGFISDSGHQGLLQGEKGQVAIGQQSVEENKKDDNAHIVIKSLVSSLAQGLVLTKEKALASGLALERIRGRLRDVEAVLIALEDLDGGKARPTGSGTCPAVEGKGASDNGAQSASEVAAIKSVSESDAHGEDDVSVDQTRDYPSSQGIESTATRFLLSKAPQSSLTSSTPLNETKRRRNGGESEATNERSPYRQQGAAGFSLRFPLALDSVGVGSRKGESTRSSSSQKQQQKRNDRAHHESERKGGDDQLIPTTAPATSSSFDGNLLTAPLVAAIDHLLALFYNERMFVETSVLSRSIATQNQGQSGGALKSVDVLNSSSPEAKKILHDLLNNNKKTTKSKSLNGSGSLMSSPLGGVGGPRRTPSRLSPLVPSPAAEGESPTAVRSGGPVNAASISLFPPTSASPSVSAKNSNEHLLFQQQEQRSVRYRNFAAAFAKFKFCGNGASGSIQHPIPDPRRQSEAFRAATADLPPAHVLNTTYPFKALLPPSTPFLSAAPAASLSSSSGGHHVAAGSSKKKKSTTGGAGGGASSNPFYHNYAFDLEHLSGPLKNVFPKDVDSVVATLLDAESMATATTQQAANPLIREGGTLSEHQKMGEDGEKYEEKEVEGDEKECHSSANNNTATAHNPLSLSPRLRGGGGIAREDMATLSVGAVGISSKNGQHTMLAIQKKKVAASQSSLPSSTYANVNSKVMQSLTKGGGGGDGGVSSYSMTIANAFNGGGGGGRGANMGHPPVVFTSVDIVDEYQRERDRKSRRPQEGHELSIGQWVVGEGGRVGGVHADGKPLLAGPSSTASPSHSGSELAGVGGGGGGTQGGTKSPEEKVDSATISTEATTKATTASASTAQVDPFANVNVTAIAVLQQRRRLSTDKVKDVLDAVHREVQQIHKEAREMQPERVKRRMVKQVEGLRPAGRHVESSLIRENEIGGGGE